MQALFNSPPSLKSIVRVLRPVGALMVSIYIVLAGQTIATAALIKRPSFYIAVLFSFLLTLGLIELARYINRRLNRDWSWREKPVTRLILQVVVCFGLMLLIVYGCVRGYFWFLDGDFEQSGYMHVEFLIITWMFVALNLQLMIKQMIPSYFATEENDANNYVKVLIAYRAKIRIVLSVDQIACLRREGNVGSCWLKDNKNIISITRWRSLPNS